MATSPSATHEHREFLQASQEALHSEYLQIALSRLGETLAAGNRTAFELLPGSSLFRAKLEAAGMGITGGNFLIAETGTVAMVTNEGNGRLTTTVQRPRSATRG